MSDTNLRLIITDALIEAGIETQRGYGQPVADDVADAVLTALVKSNHATIRDLDRPFCRSVDDHMQRTGSNNRSVTERVHRMYCDPIGRPL